MSYETNHLYNSWSAVGCHGKSLSDTSCLENLICVVILSKTLNLQVCYEWVCLINVLTNSFFFLFFFSFFVCDHNRDCWNLLFLKYTLSDWSILYSYMYAIYLLWEPYNSMYACSMVFCLNLQSMQDLIGHDRKYSKTDVHLQPGLSISTKSAYQEINWYQDGAWLDLS